MKKFSAPMFAVIRLTNEDVIATSICQGVTCYNYECPDCIDCTGVFRCLDLACNYYGG